MSQRKLAVVSTHPIQYYSPVFRALARLQSIDLRVFYTWSQAADKKLFDVGFGTTLEWDIPLQDGYAHQFVLNVAERFEPEEFRGLQNPSLIAEIEAWGAEALLVYGWCHQSHLQALRHFKGRIPVLFRGDSTLLDQQVVVAVGDAASVSEMGVPSCRCRAGCRQQQRRLFCLVRNPAISDCDRAAFCRHDSIRRRRARSRHTCRGVETGAWDPGGFCRVSLCGKVSAEESTGNSSSMPLLRL